MKKLSKLFAMLTVLTIVVSSFGMMSVSADVIGPELVTDGGFDETNGAIVYGLGNTAAVSGIEYSYAESYEGNASAHIKVSASTKVVKITNFGLTAGNTYNFSFMIKGDLHDNGMYLRMGGWSYETNAAKIIEQDGVFKESGTGDALIKITPAENGWYKVESEKAWTCGSGTGDEAVLIFPQNEGNFYIDNFSITDADGTEYVLNGGFEPDTTNAIVAEFGNTAHIDGLEYATGVGYKDNTSIHITKSAKIATISNLKLVSSSAYNFSFMIKGDLHTNGMYLRMGGWGYETNAAHITETDGKFSVTQGKGEKILTATAAENGWYKVETTKAWTCGSGTGDEVALIFPQNSANFYIDDFSITSAGASDTSGATITQFGNTAAIAGLEYSNVDAYNSTNSIHITNGGEMTTPTKLGLKKGNTYNISFMVKGTLTTSNGMYLRMGWGYTSNAAKIKSDKNGVFSVVSGAGDEILKATADSNGWYKVESTKPWTCSEMNIGFFNVQTGGGTVNFYIDNLSITESSTGTEMVTDGGFETASISGTEIIKNGSFSGEKTNTSGAVITQLGNTAAVAGLEYSTANAYSGNHSINAKVSSETVLATTANLGIATGKKYNISFYVKGKLASTNGMYVRFGWNWDTNQAKLKSTEDGVFSIASGTNLKVTEDKDGWYKVESITPWSITGNMNFLTVATGGGTVDFYIDNLSITESIPDTVIGTFGMTGDTAEKTVTINVTNNGIADGYSAILILATHKDGVMQNVAIDDNATIVELGKTETLTQTITVNDGETLKAFLWNSLIGMTPLTSSQELITVTIVE